MWPHVIAIHMCTGGIAWDLRGIAGLPSGCRGVALGFTHGLLWDWRGPGMAKGLPRDCGFANGLLPWDCQESPELWPWVLLWECLKGCAGCARRLPQDCLGMERFPIGCQGSAERLPSDCHGEGNAKRFLRGCPGIALTLPSDCLGVAFGIAWRFVRGCPPKSHHQVRNQYT